MTYVQFGSTGLGDLPVIYSVGVTEMALNDSMQVTFRAQSQSLSPNLSIQGLGDF